jgi:hypothetical protein
MNRSIRFAIAGVAVAACAAVGLAAPVWAAGPASAAAQVRTLNAIKANAASDISLRLSALATTMKAVSTNPWLTASDKSTLLNILGNDQSGLTALAPTIQADTTVAQARSDFRSIFLNYRVYLLAIPQSRLSAATDDITGGALPRLTDAKNRLSSLLSGVDSAKDTPAVQALMSDLASKIQAVTTATSGLSASILALTPSEFDANYTILATPRETLLTSRSDLIAARTDVVTVMGDLK